MNIVVRGEANDYRNTASEARKGFHKQDTHMTTHRKQTRELHWDEQLLMKRLSLKPKGQTTTRRWCFLKMCLKGDVYKNFQKSYVKAKQANKTMGK